MKNLFSLILIAMIMFTAVGFAEPLAGSWMPSESPEITEELQALFDKGLADEIRAEIEDGNAPYAGADNDYKKWYLCGHSLGGVAASMLAAVDKSYDWDGLIFLASYPQVKVEIPALSIYGTEDKVLAAGDYSKAETKGYWPEDFTERVIQGGNHAQFGSYGAQKGDGQASITAIEQQMQTSEEIIRWIENQ